MSSRACGKDERGRQRELGLTNARTHTHTHTHAHDEPQQTLYEEMMSGEADAHSRLRYFRLSINVSMHRTALKERVGDLRSWRCRVKPQATTTDKSHKKKEARKTRERRGPYACGLTSFVSRLGYCAGGGVEAREMLKKKEKSGKECVHEQS